MDRDTFAKIGSCVLDVKPVNGVNLSYKQPNATVGLHSDCELKNATFTGDFKLAPGSFTIASCEKTGLDLKIKPDLKTLDTELTIEPLKHAFNFKIKKTCAQTGAAAQIEYCSEKNAPVLTIYPKISLRNSLTQGEIVIKECALPGYKIYSTIGKVTLRSVYCPCDKKLRFGCFYNLGCAGPLCDIAFGTAAAFKQPSIPTDYFFFTKATVKNIQTSLILSNEDNKAGIETRIAGPVCSKACAAASIKFIDNKFLGLIGVALKCQECGGCANISVDTNTQIKASVQLPVHKYVQGATVKLSAVVPKIEANIVDTKPVLGVSIDFE